MNESLKQSLPNSTAVLVLGICSIALFCCLYGIIGLALGIVAIVLAKKANTLHQNSPESFTESSFKNMRAGRVCAIIGLCLSSLMFLVLIIYILLYGALAFSMLGRGLVN